MLDSKTADAMYDGLESMFKALSTWFYFNVEDYGGKPRVKKAILICTRKWCKEVHGKAPPNSSRKEHIDGLVDTAYDYGELKETGKDVGNGIISGLLSIVTLRWTNAKLF